MNYYNEIKNKLIDNEVYLKAKDYSKEKHTLITYFEIGKMLNEEGKRYGNNIIGEYSKKLVVEVNKKYNRRTLFRMRQLYNFLTDKKVSIMSTQLTWSHFTELLSFKDENKIQYYINIINQQKLSIKQLRKKIKSNEYERLPKETKEKLKTNEKSQIKDFVPNPILIKNKNNLEIVTEKALKYLILEDIESFMKELGDAFCFIGSEYKIKIGDRNNYIDLLLFNIEFNCYVVIELKITELKKEHLGQIEFYMNYIDENLKKINQNKTIGIIIYKQDNEYVIKYCSDERIIARKYILV